MTRPPPSGRPLLRHGWCAASAPRPGRARQAPTPHTAATTGSAAAAGLRSRPTTSSRLSSIPATRKKQGEETVGSPVPHGQVQSEGGDTEREVPGSLVAAAPGGVRPHQRDDRSRRQGKSPDGLGPQGPGDRSTFGQDNTLRIVRRSPWETGRINRLRVVDVRTQRPPVADQASRHTPRPPVHSARPIGRRAPRPAARLQCSRPGSHYGRCHGIQQSTQAEIAGDRSCSLRHKTANSFRDTTVGDGTNRAGSRTRPNTEGIHIGWTQEIRPERHRIPTCAASVVDRCEDGDVPRIDPAPQEPLAILI